MHESSIVDGMIDIVLRELSTRGLHGPVKEIVLKAGRMTSVVPESLLFYFDIMKKEHEPLQNTDLRVEEISLIVHCPSCDKTLELEEPNFLCETCGGVLSIRAGKEMYVESMILPDE